MSWIMDEEKAKSLLTPARKIVSIRTPKNAIKDYAD